MSELEIKNAVIMSASLNTTDGALVAQIDLDYGCTCQSFGGMTLYLPKSYTYHNMMSFAGHFIFRVMEVAGVTKWESLSGKCIRVKAEDYKIHAVGHIIKDDWFCPNADITNDETRL